MDREGKTNLAGSFHEALEEGRIQAFFQPVFRSLTQQIMGVEALARWYQPDGSMISPADFIPVLEQNGLVFELDMEILRQACMLYDEFRRRGTPVQGVSVNLSRLDFEQENLFETVCETLERYSVPREAIKLEITESIMLEDIESFEKIFLKFSEAGFHIWLDDFGSGYSSLNVLQNYTFDVIKFDMLFLRKLSARGREMLASLISMAKTLGIHTLTEGVETEEQRVFLLETGCEAQQGFYYSRPISRENLVEWVDREPGILESMEDAEYWDRIGRLNFVNPNPLKDFVERQNGGVINSAYVSSFDGSVALVECGKEQFSYIYATNGYRERIQELGFTSIGGLEHALSNQRSYQYLIIQKLVLDALRSRKIETVEFAYKDVYFRLSALFIARRLGKAMIVMRLNTFDSEKEIKTAQEMLNNGSALMSTYDLIVMIWPDRKVAKRIYAANNLASYDREATVEIALKKFCETEVEPAFRQSYMQFMDFETMEERVEKSPDKFIQDVFRMRLNRDKSNWYTARVTRLPATTEKTFMLTVQRMQDNLSYWIDKIAGNWPEMHP